MNQLITRLKLIITITGRQNSELVSYLTHSEEVIMTNSINQENDKDLLYQETCVEPRDQAMYGRWYIQQEKDNSLMPSGLQTRDLYMTVP